MDDLRTQEQIAPLPGASTINAGRAALARAAFLIVFLAVSGCGILLFTDVLMRTGLYGFKYGLLALHAVMFSLVAFVFCNSLFGFFATRRRVESEASPAPGDGAPLAPTAAVFLIYNEDVARVMAGLEATYRSLQRTGQEAAFEFFVLSDSTDPDRWIEEEIAYLRVLRRLKAVGRIHYRHRASNQGMKAGNLADFLERWGARYRYMIVFDADSLMSGKAMVELVRRMEASPRVGILQTVPGIIRAQTLFARIHQFANRLYGRVFAAGMGSWQQGGGNYIGHNAIIRIEPFMKNCRLPRLPWREPLGGQIFSHDFVEAALMHKAGYEVRWTYDLEGSYEEGPANFLESARRHRRWCQGNLQHSWLLFSHDLPFLNRCHFLLGILAYLSSLLWLCFLVLGTLVVVQFERSGLSLIPAPSFIPLLRLSLPAEEVLVFGFTFFLLLSPQFFSLADVCLDTSRRAKFGGCRLAMAGVLLETVFSILLAPILMLWHAVFVITIPMGKGVAWTGQARAPDQKLSWRVAARTQHWLTAIGLIWTAVAFLFNRTFLLWMTPIFIPLLLAIPLNVLFSYSSVGRAMRRRGILLTPEEHEMPPELIDLEKAEHHLNTVLAQVRGSAAVLALVDPYVNALHVTLQRQLENGSGSGERDDAWIRDVLRRGPAEMGREAFKAILVNAGECRQLHFGVWRAREADLAEAWASAVASYSPTHRLDFFK